MYRIRLVEGGWSVNSFHDIAELLQQCPALRMDSQGRLIHIDGGIFGYAIRNDYPEEE